MTPLKRTLRRKTSNPPARRRGAPLVVTLTPHPEGDTITLRELRRRYSVTATLDGLYTLLVARDVERRLRAKAIARKAVRR